MKRLIIRLSALFVVVIAAISAVGAFAFDNREPEYTDTLYIDFFIEDDKVPLAFFAQLPFEDVQAYDWFYRSVTWAYKNEIMNGVSSTKFAPKSDMTRAMLVTILWRYAGTPEAGRSMFSDVTTGKWYSTAVAWAAENGIVQGFDAATFGAHSFVNREQMYTILYRYMNFAELTIVLEDEIRIQQFADEYKVSDWALDAMYFMYDAGVMFMLSTLDIYARPRENAIRGEIAAAMYFFDRYAVPLSIAYE
ncbi:MAG: S-layer homology domain-containing protein [Oscillospiraceae bacterium]|nr:S-layer homology domain-containing protein [Oscillospiraceae bacterium]